MQEKAGKVETIWASRRKRVELRALHNKKEMLRLNAEIHKIQERTTLRDEFAARALAGILGNNEGMKVIAEEAVNEGDDPDMAICIAAYQFADNMLKVRKRVAV